MAAFAWPGISFEVVVLLFGAEAFVDGLLLVTRRRAARAGPGVWSIGTTVRLVLWLAGGTLARARPRSTL